LLALVLTVIVGVSSHAQAQAGSLPLEGYWELVDETRQIVASVSALPAAQAHALLSPLVDRWEAFAQVSLPSGSQMPVDNSFLIALLRLDPPDSARLSKLLDALLAAKDASPPASFTQQDVQTIGAILSRPEFQWQPDEPSLLEQWWSRIRERFFQWLARMLTNLGGSRAASALPYILTAGGLLVIFLAMIYLMRNLVAGVVAESELGAGDETGKEILTAGAALQKAQALSSAGDYRLAVRYLYLSTLFLLEERGLLPYDRSRTNREYLRGLRNLPALAAILQELVEVFDRVWYGYQPLDENSYDQYARRVEELQQKK
jgi:hypothetical protein